MGRGIERKEGGEGESGKKEEGNLKRREKKGNIKCIQPARYNKKKQDKKKKAKSPTQTHTQHLHQIDLTPLPHHLILIPVPILKKHRVQPIHTLRPLPRQQKDRLLPPLPPRRRKQTMPLPHSHPHNPITLPHHPLAPFNLDPQLSFNHLNILLLVRMEMARWLLFREAD